MPDVRVKAVDLLTWRDLNRKDNDYVNKQCLEIASFIDRTQNLFKSPLVHSLIDDTNATTYERVQQILSPIVAKEPLPFTRTTMEKAKIRNGVLYCGKDNGRKIHVDPLLSDSDGYFMQLPSPVENVDGKWPSVEIYVPDYDNADHLESDAEAQTGQDWCLRVFDLHKSKFVDIEFKATEEHARAKAYQVYKERKGKDEKLQAFSQRFKLITRKTDKGVENVYVPYTIQNGLELYIVDDDLEKMVVENTPCDKSAFGTSSTWINVGIFITILKKHNNIKTNSEIQKLFKTHKMALLVNMLGSYTIDRRIGTTSAKVDLRIVGNELNTWAFLPYGDSDSRIRYADTTLEGEAQNKTSFFNVDWCTCTGKWLLDELSSGAAILLKFYRGTELIGYVVSYDLSAEPLLYVGVKRLNEYNQKVNPFLNHHSRWNADAVVTSGVPDIVFSSTVIPVLACMVLDENVSLVPANALARRIFPPNNGVLRSLVMTWCLHTWRQDVVVLKQTLPYTKPRPYVDGTVNAWMVTTGYRKVRMSRKNAAVFVASDGCSKSEHRAHLMCVVQAPGDSLSAVCKSMGVQLLNSSLEDATREFVLYADGALVLFDHTFAFSSLRRHHLKVRTPTGNTSA